MRSSGERHGSHLVLFRSHAQRSGATATLTIFTSVPITNQTNHNPWVMLGRIDQKQLAEVEMDEAFLAHMDRVWASLHEYLQGTGWFRRRKFRLARSRAAGRDTMSTC